MYPEAAEYKYCLPLYLKGALILIALEDSEKTGTSIMLGFAGNNCHID